jgi:hypothetical protein
MSAAVIEAARRSDPAEENAGQIALVVRRQNGRAVFQPEIAASAEPAAYLANAAAAETELQWADQRRPRLTMRVA